MSSRSQLTKDLNESIKSVLGRHTKILVKYLVKLETKNDKTENRVLVFTPVRIFILTAKVPTRIEHHFNYLDIQSIESKKTTHFTIATSDKAYSISTIGDAGNFSSNADVILTDLSSAIKQIFPTIPLKHIMKKLEIHPIERLALFSDELRPSNPRNIGPCGGFSVQYACMCDFHGVPCRDEVTWDIDAIYLSHDHRILNLKDFDHLESKDLMAIVSALEYNTYFSGLKISNTRLAAETIERILHVLKRSMWLEELNLEALSLRADFIQKLALAVTNNSNSALRTFNLNQNLIEDKGAMQLASVITKISKGVFKLSLSHCGFTSKGCNQIAHALSLNQNISSSLTYLDLSGNNLKDDINNLYNFLAQPNSIEYLDISKTDTTLESLFGALLRGCSTHLTHLNVSYNSFGTKKGKEIPPSFKQFFTSSLSLKHISIANCKLPLEALKHLLLGLACNESTAGLFLDLSGNCLGQQGAHVLESCIHGVRVLSSLDISDNNLDIELSSVLNSIGKNPSIRTLQMTKCFHGMKLKHIASVMESLVNIIQKDDFFLTELILSDNKLKNDLHSFINALGSNQSLQILDISGNFMGDIGARLLAKALQINNKLRTLYLDRNNITMQGYTDIVYALEQNSSMRYIPFPLIDVAPCLKQQPDKTDFIMRKMQDLLHRNTLGMRRFNGNGFRLQHGFLLSSTHQLIDKLVSETQETMSVRPKSNESKEHNLLNEAEKCKQLLPKLQVYVRSDPHPIEVRLGKINSELIQLVKSHLEETMESMLRTGVEQCPETFRNELVISELRKRCEERIAISEEFLQNCMANSAGSEMMNKICEIEQSLAGVISDRVTDEVLEALTRYKRGLAFTDSSHNVIDDSSITSDNILRSRSSQDSICLQFETHQHDFPKLLLESPTATPQFQSRRRNVTRKIRPQSIIGLGIENLSLGNIPNALQSPTKSHSSNNSDDTCFDKEENISDSITELPSQSLTLQHLVKSRPKRNKTRAPTRPLIMDTVKHDTQDCIESFFRPGSATPSTLTPLVSPTSEGCSSLSFVDSPTISKDDDRYSNATSDEETTPIIESRKLFKFENELNTMRSRSTDNMEKYSCHKGNTKNEDIQTTCTECTKSQSSEFRKPETSFTKPLSIAPKPRPWSVLGHESKEDLLGNDSTNDVNDLLILSDSTTGGSILGITPGLSMGGGSIVGITPGAALEKKNVREPENGINN